MVLQHTHRYGDGSGMIFSKQSVCPRPAREAKQRLPETPFPIKIAQFDRKKIFLNESGNI
jgi:hypothetical protein